MTESTQNSDAASKAFVEAELMRQEHRLHKILMNFFVHSRTWTAGDPRRSAATEAIVYRVAVALLPGPATTGIGITALAGLFFAWQANRLLESQNAMLSAQTEQIQVQTQQIQIQTSLTEASRRASLNFELANILQGINEHSQSAKSGESNKPVRLSNGLYGRIVALSRNLKPYRFLDDAGKLIERPLSPERGQLLISLHSSGVDLGPIARDVDFSSSDLTKANLRGIVLDDIGLAKSNMAGADLSFAGLRGADLRETDLRNADLSYANLTLASDDSCCYFGSLEGAKLEGCIFYGAMFNTPPDDLFQSKARLNGVLLTDPPEQMPPRFFKHRLNVEEDLGLYPSQVVLSAFEHARTAKEHGEFEDLSPDPLTNAKRLAHVTVVIADMSSDNVVAASTDRLLESKLVPQSLWGLSEDLQRQLSQHPMFLSHLPNNRAVQPAPAPPSEN